MTSGGSFLTIVMNAVGGTGTSDLCVAVRRLCRARQCSSSVILALEASAPLGNL